MGVSKILKFFCGYGGDFCGFSRDGDIFGIFGKSGCVCRKFSDVRVFG